MRKLLIPFINVWLLIVFNGEDGVDLLQLINFQVKLDYPLPILEQVLGMLWLVNSPLTNFPELLEYEILHLLEVLIRVELWRVQLGFLKVR